MQEIEYIEHDGVIKFVDVANSTIVVMLNDANECGECPAAKLCSSPSSADTTVTVAVRNPRDYKLGDEVTVRGSECLHQKAIMLATVIPSIALIGVMILVYWLTGEQLTACLSGIGAMVLFFFLLWICRDKLAHEFAFEVVSGVRR